MKSYTGNEKYFIELINKYFKKLNDKQYDTELEKFTKLDNRGRIQYVKVCNYPEVLDKLYEVGDRDIKTAIKRTDYYTELGQFKDVLHFNKEERLQFAKHDSYKNLFSLLMFENDIDVINAAVYNPTISITELEHLYDVLKHRKTSKVDEVYLRIIDEAIPHKKRVMQKASRIEKNSQNLEDPEKLANTVAHLLDEDKEVIKFSLYALNKADIKIFRMVILDRALLPDKTESENNLAIFKLEKVIESIFSGEFFKETSQIDQDLSIPVNTFLGESFSQIERELEKIFKKRKFKILEYCEQDPSDLNSILCLVYMDLDADPEFVPRVNKIISLDDIFLLMDDDSTPRAFIKEGLQLLDQSPNEEVKKRVQEIYFKESERLWARLKEMEVSVNAYFDLIFQSISLPRIQEKKMINRRLTEAREIMTHMLSEDHNVTSDLRRYLKLAFEKTNSIIKNDLKKLYGLYDSSTESELEEIQGLLQQISFMSDMDKGKEEGFAVRPGEEERVSKKVLAIWRSAISSYLGRVKELSEVLKVKYEGLTKKNSVGVIDFQRVISQAGRLEETHKKQVKCKLPIHCKDCKKRGCSSERFLRETLLWVDELLRIEQNSGETVS